MHVRKNAILLLLDTFLNKHFEIVNKVNLETFKSIDYVF